MVLLPAAQLELVLVQLAASFFVTMKEKVMLERTSLVQM